MSTRKGGAGRHCTRSTTTGGISVSQLIHEPGMEGVVHGFDECESRAGMSRDELKAAMSAGISVVDDRLTSLDQSVEGRLSDMTVMLHTQTQVVADFVTNYNLEVLKLKDDMVAVKRGKISTGDELNLKACITRAIKENHDTVRELKREMALFSKENHDTVREIKREMALFRCEAERKFGFVYKTEDEFRAQSKVGRPTTRWNAWSYTGDLARDP